MSVKQRGFGSMSAERKSEIAAMGGRAAHLHGTAHQWTAEEARVAGKKGGINSAASKRAQQAQRSQATSDDSVSNPATAN